MISIPTIKIQEVKHITINPKDTQLQNFEADA